MKVNRGTLSISSPAFAHGARIPDAHSRHGAGVSPPLEWTGVPAGTRSFALVMHDPDAPVVGGFTHWLVYGIPGHATGVPEGGGSGWRSGVDSRGTAGWTPVAPPAGHGDHHYFFHLYALDQDPELPTGLGAEDLLRRIEPFVIEQTRLVGVYRNE